MNQQSKHTKLHHTVKYATANDSKKVVEEHSKKILAGAT